MGTPQIVTENITKVYHMGETEVYALGGVSISIEQGEFVAIMGASGSGKTTIMNIIGCLDSPTNGRYLLEGEDIIRHSRNELAYLRNKRFGFVYQNFNLLPRTSAIENVELPLMYWNHHSARDYRRLAEGQLARVGLSDRTHHYPNQLSGGQQQRR